jgi:ribose-phosphate pyrophosphokinase
MTAMGKCRLDHVVGADDVVAGVDSRIAVITDDMIGTGEKLSLAVAACRKGGARKVFAAPTHGLFLAGSEAMVTNPDLDGIVVADTVPPFRLWSAAARQKVTVVDSTRLAAEAIDWFKG